MRNIVKSAKQHPDGIAILHNGRPVTYAEFLAAIYVTRKHLENYELPKAKTAVVVIADLLDAWVVSYALRALGTNTVFAESIAVAEGLQLTDVCCVVTSDSENSVNGVDASPWPGAALHVVPDHSFTPKTLPDEALDEEAPMEGGHILYTSGTTGAYKKLFFSPALQEISNRISAGEYTPDSIYHCVGFPLWSGVGFKFPQRIWQNGGCVIFDQRPDWYKFFLESGMTNAILIPLQVYQLLAWRGDVLLPKNWGPFSLAVTGGFLSEQKTAQLLSDVTDNLEFVFGMTELNPSPLRTRVTSPEDRLWFEAVEGRSVEIVDEYDNSCAPGQEGILRVRICDQDFHGYMDDPEATAKFFRDGYFYPGDLAISRSDGRLQPLGRNLDVINVGGHKVPCAPLERELQKMLKVDAVCLFTGVDNAGQQEIVVALKTDEVPAEPDLGRVSHKLRIFDKVRFEFERDFPTTRTGMQKVDRVALRKLLFPDNQADNN